MGKIINNLKIHLIRHGETVANTQKLFYGFSDVELSDIGSQKLLPFKDKYISSSISKKLYISSGLKRTNKTLEILFGDVEFTIVPDFKEMNFGDFELKSHVQLENNQDYINWLENYETFTLPNGESKEVFEKRVIEAYKILLEQLFHNYDEVFIVTHNGVICVLMDYLFKNLENKKFYDWKLENGDSYIIKYSNKTIYKLIN